MLNSFKVKHGTTAQLFDAKGIIRPNVKLELGSWYICTDTASVYICVSENSKLILKRINSESFESVDTEINSLTTRVEQVERNALGYVRIESEGELPHDFTAADFNPKTIYYIEVDKEKHYIDTYVFDMSVQSYMCSHSGRNSSGDINIEDIDLDSMIQLVHGGTASGNAE
jgi:hypothetical protein